MGLVAGGVVGGVLGNQIGSGRGNTAATIVGAGAGAYAGNQVEKNAKKKSYWVVAVRLDNGSHKSITSGSQPAFKQGRSRQDRRWQAARADRQLTSSRVALRDSRSPWRGHGPRTRRRRPARAAPAAF